MIKIDESIRYKLLKLQMGSCTCCTKTPEVKYHLADCNYRLASEMLEYVQGIHNIVNAERERLNKISESMSDSRDIHCSPDDYCEFCSEGHVLIAGLTHLWSVLMIGMIDILR